MDRWSWDIRRQKKKKKKKKKAFRATRNHRRGVDRIGRANICLAIARAAPRVYARIAITRSMA
jgi:hypothetical protein